MKKETEKAARSSLIEIEKRLRSLTEIIKYAEQYQENRAYNYRYKKSKNPDAYLQKHESEIILYGGAKRMLEQYGITSKNLSIDSLKKEYQELSEQKQALSFTQKTVAKESKQLQQKLDNIRSYLNAPKQQNADMTILHAER